jgi:hypothetical protein
MPTLAGGRASRRPPPVGSHFCDRCRQRQRLGATIAPLACSQAVPEIFFVLLPPFTVKLVTSEPVEFENNMILIIKYFYVKIYIIQLWIIQKAILTISGKRYLRICWNSSSIIVFLISLITLNLNM